MELRLNLGEVSNHLGEVSDHTQEIDGLFHMFLYKHYIYITWIYLQWIITILEHIYIQKLYELEKKLFRFYLHCP